MTLRWCARKRECRRLGGHGQAVTAPPRKFACCPELQSMGRVSHLHKLGNRGKFRVPAVLPPSERSAARLAHQSGGLGVPSSNLGAPTKKLKYLSAIWNKFCARIAERGMRGNNLGTPPRMSVRRRRASTHADRRLLQRRINSFYSRTVMRKWTTNHEESTMRFAIIGAAAALAVLAGVSAGYAQNRPSPPPPSPKSTAPTASNRDYESYWPTTAQETAIPYRPCEIAVGWDGRHLICWSTVPWGQIRITRWHGRIRHHWSRYGMLNADRTHPITAID